MKRWFLIEDASLEGGCDGLRRVDDVLGYVYDALIEGVGRGTPVVCYRGRLRGGWPVGAAMCLLSPGATRGVEGHSVSRGGEVD